VAGRHRGNGDTSCSWLSCSRCRRAIHQGAKSAETPFHYRAVAGATIERNLHGTLDVRLPALEQVSISTPKCSAIVAERDPTSDEARREWRRWCRRYPEGEPRTTRIESFGALISPMVPALTISSTSAPWRRGSVRDSCRATWTERKSRSGLSRCGRFRSRILCHNCMLHSLNHSPALCRAYYVAGPAFTALVPHLAGSQYPESRSDSVADHDIQCSLRLRRDDRGDAQRMAVSCKADCRSCTRSYTSLARARLRRFTNTSISCTRGGNQSRHFTMAALRRRRTEQCRAGCNLRESRQDISPARSIIPQFSDSVAYF